MRLFVMCAFSAVALSVAALPVSAENAATIAPSKFTYGTILSSLDDAVLARDAGFNLMNAFVAWSAVEPTRGTYIFEQKDKWGRPEPNDLTNVIESARTNALRVGLRLDSPPGWAGRAVYALDPADVEDYVYHVVRYGAGTISYVEVFNEMNLPIEWGTSPTDPAGYARILAGAYRGAKRADPGVVVVSAAPSQRTGGLGGTMEDVDWLNGLYDAGGSASFDALGVHAYIGNQDPASDPTVCSPMCFRDIELYRAVMEQRGDSAKPAMITELGTLEQTSVDLGDYAWMELPSSTRAAFLVSALRMASTNYPWLIGATIFNLDYAANRGLPSTSERPWFSLLNADRSPRQAYLEFQSARINGFLS